MTTKYMQYKNPVGLELARCARIRKTITYGELAVLVGLPRAGCHMVKVMSSVLSEIYHGCKRYKLPPLTSLVVNSNTGIPGNGFWSLQGQEKLSTKEKRKLMLIHHHAVFQEWTLERR